MVTLLSNANGQLYTCSQMQDYIFRGPDMEQCSLLAFVIDTWEEAYMQQEVDAVVDPSVPKHGQPAHIQVHYTADHPKWQTHCRVFHANGHNTLPRITGPWLP